MPDTSIDFDLLLKAGGQYAASKRAISFSERATRRRELLVVKTGTVEIRLGNRLLDTLGERGIFGEMALIDHTPGAQRRSH